MRALYTVGGSGAGIGAGDWGVGEPTACRACRAIGGLPMRCTRGPPLLCTALGSVTHGAYDSLTVQKLDSPNGKSRQRSLGISFANIFKFLIGMFASTASKGFFLIGGWRCS